MKNSETKTIVIGMGEMGKVALKTLVERQYNVVAVIDLNPEIQGKDAGTVAGISPIGIRIGTGLEGAIKQTRPSLAFFAIAPGFQRLAQDLKLCAEYGINVATINMDPFHKIKATESIFKDVDETFRRNGVTLMSSGINDIWWSGIGMDMCGTCKRIDSIDFTNKLPLENMSALTGAEFHVNDSPENFRKEIEGRDLALEDSIQGPLLALLENADILGLKIDDLQISADPVICQEDLYVEPWDDTVIRGRMQGQAFNIRAATKQGITLTTSMIIKVLDPGEKPGTSWTIKGEPNLHMELGDICGEITTTATTINRIPQIIAAKPGIVTLKDLPERPPYGGPVRRNS